MEEIRIRNLFIITVIVIFIFMGVVTCQSGDRIERIDDMVERVCE